MLEPVGVEVAVAQRRVGLVVVIEVDDLHVVSELVLGELGQQAVGLLLCRDADADHVVVCLVASSEDRAAGSQRECGGG